VILWHQPLEPSYGKESKTCWSLSIWSRRLHTRCHVVGKNALETCKAFWVQHRLKMLMLTDICRRCLQNASSSSQISENFTIWAQWYTQTPYKQHEVPLPQTGIMAPLNGWGSNSFTVVSPDLSTNSNDTYPRLTVYYTRNWSGKAQLHCWALTAKHQCHRAPFSPAQYAGTKPSTYGLTYTNHWLCTPLLLPTFLCTLHPAIPCDNPPPPIWKHLNLFKTLSHFQNILHNMLKWLPINFNTQMT
jgi:hypothetical protein